jgi:hypothetical protein
MYITHKENRLIIHCIFLKQYITLKVSSTQYFELLEALIEEISEKITIIAWKVK